MECRLRTDRRLQVLEMAVEDDVNRIVRHPLRPARGVRPTDSVLPIGGGHGSQALRAELGWAGQCHCVIASSDRGVVGRRGGVVYKFRSFNGASCAGGAAQASRLVGRRSCSGPSWTASRPRRCVFPYGAYAVLCGGARVWTGWGLWPVSRAGGVRQVVGGCAKPSGGGRALPPRLSTVAKGGGPATSGGGGGKKSKKKKKT
jgi:hypothetical protein